MLQLEESEVLDLDNAIKTIDQYTSGPWNSSVLSALDTLLQGTRNLDGRDFLNSKETLSKIIRLFAVLSEETIEHDTEGRLKLLRCVGNLVADNDDNRALLMEDSTCLKGLQRRMSVESMQRGPTGIKEADTALIVLYNLCIDTTEIQQSALKKDLHISIFEYIHGRPWDFGEESDEDLFENSIMTLNEILQHKSEVNHPEHLTSKFTSEILRLPCVNGILDVLFEAAALSILPYLKDAAFQEAVVSNRQLPLLWSLLEKAAFVAAIPNIETSSAPAIEKDIFNTITEISLLPSFPDHLQSDYVFIRILTTACILTENDSKAASKSIAACILLGNFATTDIHASEVVSKLNLVSLFHCISLKAYGRSKSSNQSSPIISSATNETSPVPTDAVYLHAAGGMLRHISRPRHIRETHFTDPAAPQASIALCQYSEAEVQIQGLRLFRHLVAINMATMSHSINNHYASSLLKVFAEGDNDKVKLEVCRTMVRILRALSSSNHSETTADQQPQSFPEVEAADHDDAKHTLLQSFLATPAVADPLVFAVTHQAKKSNPQMALAQAEGWFGLVLLKLSGDTGRNLCEKCLDRDDVLDALKAAISTKSIASESDQRTALAVAGEMTGAPAPAQQLQDKCKARDNAIAFAAEMIKDGGVHDELRQRLQALLSEAGIDVKQRL